MHKDYKNLINSLKKQNILIIGAYDESLIKYGYNKTNNIKFLNLPPDEFEEYELRLKKKKLKFIPYKNQICSVDYLINIQCIGKENLSKYISEKFDIIILEHLPFTEYDILLYLEKIIYKNTYFLIKGFPLEYNLINKKVKEQYEIIKIFFQYTNNECYLYQKIS